MKKKGINLNPKQWDFIQAFLNNEADKVDPKDPKGRGWVGGWRATGQMGRGAGKSHLLCHLIAISAGALPKARAGLVGLTLRQVSDVILSQSADIFREHGFEEYNPKTGIGCYTVCQRPPLHWHTAHNPLRNFDNCICFANGYTVEFLSVGQIEAKRGTNLDQLFIDESATIKETHYNKILRPTVRANKYVYSDTRPGRKGFNHPLHWSIIDFSSAPWFPEGMWIYKTEELAKQNPKKYYYMEGTAYDNLMNLPGDYIEDIRETSDPLSFDVEIMNKRKKKVSNSFYSSFSDKNVYFDYLRNDYDPNRPIETSWDFNGYFTCMSIWQDFGSDFKCIDVLFVKEAPEGLLVNKLCTDFLSRYKDHKSQRVTLFGDSGGTNKDANRKPHFDTISDIFRKANWVVTNEVQMGYPRYAKRYPVVNKVLLGTEKNVPTISFNGWTAKAMVLSLENAPIIGDNFEKDKRSEGKVSTPQEFATHLSDTYDYIIYRKFSNRIAFGGDRNSPITFRKPKN